MFKRGKFPFLVVLSLFLLASFVTANNHTDIDLAYEWLYGQMNKSDWNKEPSEIALSILALGGEGFDVSEGIEKLKDLESLDSWGDGDIKDTSLAILALHKVGENVEDNVEWLISKHEKALSGGIWNIQLDAPDPDTLCELKYQGADFLFRVNGTDVVQTDPDYCPQPSNWIDFLTCIKRDDEVNITETINVDCLLDASSSVIFQTPANEFYIVDEGDPLRIENGCFYRQGSCNCDYSGYAGWVLKEVSSDSFVKPFLMTQCANPRAYSFLYAMTRDNLYSSLLENKQDPDGSWGNQNLRTTYLGLLALKKIGRFNNDNVRKAQEFVEFFQDPDGSWNQNVEDTAFILYVLYSSDIDIIRPPTNGNGGAVCGDGLIEGLEECEDDSDCSVGEFCSVSGLNACECIPNGSVTAYCGDGRVNSLSEDCDGFDLDGKSCTGLNFASGTLKCNPDTCKFDTSSCIPKPRTCPSGLELDEVTGECVEPFPWIKWAIIILSVLLGLLIIFYVYTKYFKKKRRKPTFTPATKTPYKMTKYRVPIKRPSSRSASDARRDSKIEKELEESIKRAKEILKK